MKSETTVPCILVCVGVTLAAIIAVSFLPRVPQPQSYHSFADRRASFGIPNFLDVISNVAFLIIGVAGILVAVRSTKFVDSRERWPYLTLFVGVVLTCFGSAYYHLNPNNATLVWDRLPMTLGFMSILAAIIAERMGVKIGLSVLPPLLAVGIASVLQWRASELRGAGDLRFYLAVQFLPMLLILLLVALFPARYTRTSDLLVIVLFYTFAKVLESADRMIFEADGSIVSGHTLKHLAAAAAVYWIVRMLNKREPITAPMLRAASAE